MTITDANIYTTVFTDVRAVIVAAAPFVTNSSTSATTAAGIEGKYNDKKTSKPQIVIEPPKKDESSGWKFGSNEGKKFINVTVECYHKGLLGTQQLAEQVEASIKANNFGGMELVGIASDQAFTDPNRSKYQMKSTTFTFDRE